MTRSYNSFLKACLISCFTLNASTVSALDEATQEQKMAVVVPYSTSYWTSTYPGWTNTAINLVTLTAPTDTVVTEPWTSTDMMVFGDDETTSSTIPPATTTASSTSSSFESTRSSSEISSLSSQTSVSISTPVAPTSPLSVESSFTRSTIQSTSSSQTFTSSTSSTLSSSSTSTSTSATLSVSTRASSVSLPTSGVSSSTSSSPGPTSSHATSTEIRHSISRYSSSLLSASVSLSTTSRHTIKGSTVPSLKLSTGLKRTSQASSAYTTLPSKSSSRSSASESSLELTTSSKPCDGRIIPSILTLTGVQWVTTTKSGSVYSEATPYTSHRTIEQCEPTRSASVCKGSMVSETKVITKETSIVISSGGVLTTKYSPVTSTIVTSHCKENQPTTCAGSMVTLTKTTVQTHALSNSQTQGYPGVYTTTITQQFCAPSTSKIPPGVHNKTLSIEPSSSQYVPPVAIQSTFYPSIPVISNGGATKEAPFHLLAIGLGVLLCL